MCSLKLLHFSLRQLTQQQNNSQILPAKRSKSSSSDCKMRPSAHHFAFIIAVEQALKLSQSLQL